MEGMFLIINFLSHELRTMKIGIGSEYVQSNDLLHFIARYTNFSSNCNEIVHCHDSNLI